MVSVVAGGDIRSEVSLVTGTCEGWSRSVGNSAYCTKVYGYTSLTERASFALNVLPS